MLYTYSKTWDIEQLRSNKRDFFIIKNVKTKDIGEYLNSFLIVLGNNGVNINIFTIAKIRKTDSYNYEILMTVRKNANINDIICMKRVLSMFDDMTIVS